MAPRGGYHISLCHLPRHSFVCLSLPPEVDSCIATNGIIDRLLVGAREARIDVCNCLLGFNSARQRIAITRWRSGLSTNSAKPTTKKFMIAVATNTMCQLPVDDLMRLATGTRNAEVPFAV